MQRLLALSSPDEWASHCVPRHMDRAQLVRSTAGVLDDVKVPVRCLEPVVLIGRKGRRRYKLVIVTESHLYLTELGKCQAPPPPLRFADLVSAQILAGVADFFLDDAVAVHSQHVVLEFQTRFVEMYTFEPCSKLFFHIQSAWMNALTRIVGGHPPTAHLGTAGFMRQYFDEMAAAVEAERSLVSRRALLDELAGVAWQSVELKRVFFESTRLLSVLLRDLHRLREATQQAHERRSELRYVVSVLKLLGAVLFNSQPALERVRLLTQGPFEFDHVVALIVNDFCRRELRDGSDEDTSSDEEEEDDEAVGESFFGRERRRRERAEKRPRFAPEHRPAFEALNNDVCDAQVFLMLELNNVVQMAALDRDKVEETLGEHVVRAPQFGVRVRGWVARVIELLDEAGHRLRARQLAGEALERRRARRERAEQRRREAAERTARRERPSAAALAESSSSSSGAARILRKFRFKRQSDVAEVSVGSSSSSSSGSEQPLPKRRSRLGALCRGRRRDAAEPLLDGDDAPADTQEKSGKAQARARAVLGDESDASSSDSGTSDDDESDGDDAASDDSRSDGELEDEFRETPEEAQEARERLLLILHYARLLHQLLLGSFEVRDTLRDECEEEMRYFLTNAAYLDKIDEDVILGFMARRELEGVRTAMFGGR